MTMPNSAFRFTDGVTEVSLSVLFNKIPRSAGRFTQWIERTRPKLLGAPKDVQSYFTPEFLNGPVPARNNWITAGDALGLLTYSTSSYLNQSLIQVIEAKSGIKLPVDANKSTFEGQFGIQLSALLRSFWDSGRAYYEIEPQRTIGHYRVDFLVTEKTTNPDGSPQNKLFVIEFDEIAHQKQAYQKRDRQRDLWFRKNRPDIRLIRVKHAEQDRWLEAVCQLKQLVSLEDCYANCLRIACSSLSNPELIITSESSQTAYQQNKNECYFLLSRPTQRLREMKDILVRLGIHFTGVRSIRFKRAKLRGYTL